jgi:uncharacterized membrane protein HdeD (DUF308 family)
MLLLALVPAFVGILGMAQLYRNYKDSNGYMYLISGLLFFIPSALLLFGAFDSGVFVGILKIAVYLILTVIYLVIALSSVLDAYFGSVFRVFKS